MQRGRLEEREKEEAMAAGARKKDEGREREEEDKEREGGGRIGLKFSDNETSPVIVPAVINGVPLYSGSPCPWESKR